MPDINSRLGVPGIYLKEAVARARLVRPIKASDQYKGYNNEDGDEATGDTCQTTKQKPLKQRPAGQAKTNLPDNKAKPPKIKKEKIKKFIKENDKSKGCSKCSHSETGCYKCNPVKKLQYE